MPHIKCFIVGCFDEENQQHFLKCRALLKNLDITYFQDMKNISYNDIFSDVKKQKKVIDVFIQLIDTRNLKLKSQQKS